MPLAGDELPELRTSVPGPASIALAGRLAQVESRNITALAPIPPIFWTEARGPLVRDADGNTYIDLTAGFGVAAAGHANPAVARAIADQAARLPHGLGDVYPPDIKVRLLERLAEIAPGTLTVSILGSAGAEAVEAALKSALLRTGRAGVLAFQGAYHGLTFGALAATWRPEFREPFTAQLFSGVRFAPFPRAAGDLDACLEAARGLLEAAESSPFPIGAIIVEPILGRGGLVVPPPGFLAALRGLADGARTLLVFDEIYTGCGRTGRWFACEHEAVVPDILLVGKALTGSIALSAAIGTPAAMSGWPESTGEAIHTSTFLGNPVACAAALAQLDEIERLGLIERAAALGERIEARVRDWVELPGVAAHRGRGLLQGVLLDTPQRAARVVAEALQSGVLLLAEGDGDVLAITPPAVITDPQLDHALAAIERALRLA
ncbi:MAG TPA: aspartate aminotransferase family protein [Longimicrobiales bacterium]|nr:aspartate aminotransferase family protein [Longimicrobiales bacterium]